MQEKNKKYLDLFKQDMVEKGLAPKTIKKHVNNIDFFLNTFLLREGVFTMEEGLLRADEFFDFFIRKCMWSSPNSIKENGASLKKFYKSMADHEFISQLDSKDFSDQIKYGMPMWLHDFEMYMSDSSYNPFW